MGLGLGVHRVVYGADFQNTTVQVLANVQWCYSCGACLSSIRQMYGATTILAIHLVLVTFTPDNAWPSGSVRVPCQLALSSRRLARSLMKP